MNEQNVRDLEEARAFFAQDRFAMETTGIEILDVDFYYAKCLLKLDKRHKNATGMVMGGAIFTLADFSFAVASNFGQTMTVTDVSQISFLGVAKGEKLIAVCKLVKDGKRSCFYETTIEDELGNLVARVTSHGTHLEKKQEQ